MNVATMTAQDWQDCPFPFFGDNPQKEWYKIYNDGGHFIATRIVRSQLKPPTRNYSSEAIDILFDSLYYAAQKQGIRYKKNDDKLANYIKSGILKLYPDMPDIDEYVTDKIERKEHNYWARVKRFKRKANLNRWNYFVTFTYDDKKHNEETFRTKLRKCLSNLHTRRGWRYMGVFENAPETGRLHFHGLLYIPDGEMIGRITEKQDYDKSKGQMQTIHLNSFFLKNFGRNDFAEVSEMELKRGNRINYILKYIGKTGERVCYSRGIPTEICLQLEEADKITAFTDFVEKFILFDNVVDWERDIACYRRKKQVTFTDILCNPPWAV